MLFTIDLQYKQQPDKSYVSLYSLPAKPKKITLNDWRQSFVETIHMKNSDNTVPGAGFILNISVL